MMDLNSCKKFFEPSFISFLVFNCDFVNYISSVSQLEAK